MRMGFEPMPASTRDQIWLVRARLRIPFAAIFVDILPKLIYAYDVPFSIYKNDMEAFIPR